MGTLHSPKLQHYWSLTIRLFCIISRTLVDYRNVVGVFCSPSWLGNRISSLTNFNCYWMKVSKASNFKLSKEISVWDSVLPFLSIIRAKSTLVKINKLVNVFDTASRTQIHTHTHIHMQVCVCVCLCLVHLCDGISNSYGLFNDQIWFIFLL